MERFDGEQELLSGGEGSADEDQSGESQNDEASKGAEDQSDNFDYDGEVKKRGAKNVLLENKKKAEELKSLKTRLSELEAKASKGGEGQPKKEELNDFDAEFIDIYKKEGYSEEFAKKLLKLQGRISQHHANVVLAPAQRVIYAESLDTAVNAIEKDENVGFMAKKLKTELKEAIKKYNPRYWGDQQLVRSVLGNLVLENREKIFGKSETVMRDTGTEGNRTGGGTGGAAQGISDDVARGYAEANDLAWNTAEDKKLVREIIKLRASLDATTMGKK